MPSGEAGYRWVKMGTIGEIWVLCDGYHWENLMLLGEAGYHWRNLGNIRGSWVPKGKLGTIGEIWVLSAEYHWGIWVPLGLFDAIGGSLGRSG